MPTEAKRETVAELREQLAQSSALIVSEYRGLTVKEIGEIRRTLRKSSVTYKVVKNRLLKIAAAETLGTALDGLLVGPTAVAFGSDPVATAKALLDAVKPYKQVKVTGGMLGAGAIDAEGVIRLATLPSRDVLLAQIAGVTVAPLAQTAGLFDAPLRDIAGLVSALADKRAAA